MTGTVQAGKIQNERMVIEMARKAKVTFKSYQIRLEQNKVTKRYIRYATDREDASLNCVYLRKDLLGKTPPKEVSVTVTPA